MATCHTSIPLHTVLHNMVLVFIILRGTRVQADKYSNIAVTLTKDPNWKIEWLSCSFKNDTYTLLFQLCHYGSDLDLCKPKTTLWSYLRFFLPGMIIWLFYKSYHTNFDMLAVAIMHFAIKSHNVNSTSVDLTLTT